MSIAVGPPSAPSSVPLFAAVLCLPGCITSPVWGYGATNEARQTRLEACPAGMLDDAEDNDNQILKRDGRDGYWFSFKDPWGSTVEPAGSFVMSRSDREGGGYAARIRGTIAPSGDSLYVGMGFSLTDPKTPHDISRARGIRFWAKGSGRVRFKTPDANTVPEGDRCGDCYNDFGVDLYLQDQWVRYTVPFDKMEQQPGWGDRAPSVSTRELFAVEWQLNTPGAAYDVWVDDIELVGCEPDVR